MYERMYGRRLGLMDLDTVGVDTSVNIAAPARSSIVESLMKARMETFEARLVVIIIIVIIIVVIVVVVLVTVVVFLVFVVVVLIVVVALVIALVITVIITAAVVIVVTVLVVGVPSMMVPSTRWMTMITVTEMVEVRR